MHKILFILITLLPSVFLVAQDKKTLEPSGNIVSKDIAVSGFDAIEAGGLYELILTEGSKEAVKIEADDNVINLFSVSTNGNKLIIGMPELKNYNINSKKKDRQGLRWKVYVTYTKLKSLEAAIVGSVSATTPIKSDVFEINNKTVGNMNLQVTTNKLNVHNVGVGNLTLKGTATDAIVKNSGVGKFDGEELVVQTMDIDNSGIGSAEVNVEKNLVIKQNFFGKVKNKGNAKTNQWEGVEI